VPDWAVVCLLAANHGSNCSFALAMDSRAMDGCIVFCGIISSYQSAATFEIVKVLLILSLSHVEVLQQVLDFNFTFSADLFQVLLS